MKPPIAAQIRKEEARKSKKAVDWFQRWIEDLRRRRMQAEQDRRKKWLLLLLLWALESKPVQALFALPDSAPQPGPAKRSPARKSAKSNDLAAEDDPRTDYERLYMSDYSTRFGEEHLQVMDGLTWADIVALNRIHRPWLFPKFEPVPGMPTRYTSPEMKPHIWTLLDHLKSDYHRSDAFLALKLVVDKEAHDWIDACAISYGGWKNLCAIRQRTPNATIAEFPRAAARWRSENRVEAKERKREAEETLDNGPKPPGLD